MFRSLITLNVMLIDSLIGVASLWRAEAPGWWQSLAVASLSAGALFLVSVIRTLGDALEATSAVEIQHDSDISA